MITFEQIKNNEDVKTYITKADASLKALGYTEHSFAHVGKVSFDAAYILGTLGYDERTVELARIAGHLHDIGNLVNRVDHSQSGAVMAFRLLDKLGMPADEIATVATHAITLTPPNARALAAIRYADVLASRGIKADYATSVYEGVRAAIDLARRENSSIICLGSLYLYREVSEALKAALSNN